MFCFSASAGEDPLLGDQHQYKYMTVDDMKSLGDDSRMDVTNDEKSDYRISMGAYLLCDTSGDLALFMFGISRDLKINLFVYFRLLMSFHSIFGFLVFLMFATF